METQLITKQLNLASFSPYCLEPSILMGFIKLNANGNINNLISATYILSSKLDRVEPFLRNTP